MLNVYRTGTTIAEFRPGIDTINVELESAVNNWVDLFFSYDSGETWVSIAHIVDTTSMRIHVVGSVFTFRAPAGRATVNAKVRVDLYDTESSTTLLSTDESDIFTVTLWPDGFMKTIFPESLTSRETASTDLILVGLGDARLTANAYLFKVDTEDRLDRLFPPHTSAAKAWRLASQQSPQNIFVMRAGDYNEFLNLNPPSPRSYRYLYEALSIAYDALSRIRFGVVCPVDAVADLPDAGMGSLFTSQLSQFCLEQTMYMHPVVGVIAATTNRRVDEINLTYNKKTIQTGTTTPVNLDSVRGGMRPNWNNAIVNGISLVSIDHLTPSGIGVLAYDSIIKEMTWLQPGDLPGTPVPVQNGNSYSIQSSSGNGIVIAVTRLPLFDFAVDVTVGYSPVHSGAKFVYPVYGYTAVEYTEFITGVRVRENFPVSPAVAATIAALREDRDPLNKAIAGLDTRTPVLYEALVSLLASGGVNSIRKTIAKGNTLGTGVTVFPGDNRAGLEQGWSKMKNVRIANLLVRAIKTATQPLIGGLGVTMEKLESAARTAVQPYLPNSVEAFNVSAVRSGVYSADIHLSFRSVGTLETLTTTVSVGV